MTNACVPRKQSGIANVFSFHVNDEFVPENDQANEDPACASAVFCEDLSGELQTLKIPPAAVQVLALAPLAHAAWVNETLNESKRNLALQAAELKGISPDSVSYRLLEDWLSHRPDPTMMTVWHDYVGALRWILTDASFRQLEQTTLERTRAILRATSSCFGIGVFGDTERSILDRVKSAF